MNQSPPPGNENLARLGLEAVLSYLEREKIEVLSINLRPEADPQVIAQVCGEKAFIIVRTALHPHRSLIDADQHLHVVALAHEAHAVPYFASVQILPSPDSQPGVDSFPIPGTPYAARIEGLDIMATSDTVIAAEFPEDTNPYKLEACRVYARAINTLDVTGYEPWLADDFAADSQMLLDEPRSKAEYLAYLREKMQNFRDHPEFSICAEIAFTAAFGAGPCVILTQSTPDTSEFTYLITMRDDKIIKSCMCVIPPPEQCRRTGEFPR